MEDRRGTSAPRRAGAIGGAGLLIVIVVALLTGVDPSAILYGGGGAPAVFERSVSRPPTAAEEELADFASVVLADTEDTWSRLFAAMGRRYEEPRLVLFRDAVESACGYAAAATGPFYCPADAKLYLDLSFFDELARRLGAPGDFAQAYVIAHEVGHHVQNLLGVTDDVQSMRGRLTEAEYNDLSVRLELQADFYAGVWAHHADHARDLLEAGDLEEALNAAAAIGDDRLQRRARGYVVPETFTHGTSAQRAHWFRRGYETGDPTRGDTFSSPLLPPSGK